MNYLVGHWCRAQAITHWYLGGRGKLISILRAKIEVTSKIIFAMGSAVENYGYYLVRWALVEGLGLLVLCEFILGFTIRVYRLLIFGWQGQNWQGQNESIFATSTAEKWTKE